jgi:hypothetical protein
MYRVGTIFCVNKEKEGVNPDGRVVLLYDTIKIGNLIRGTCGRE